ncbi:MAG: ABC-F family ATP-binding cassette domain-containing protein [Erysipelotrichaceae bacterium]
MLISIEDTYLAFNDRILIDHCSFNMNNHDKIGIIGVNGTGKSSFLKLIANDGISSTSTIIKTNGMKIGYLKQHPVFNEELSIKETINSICDPDRLFEATSMLNQLGISNHDRCVKFCSGGELKRLALACVLLHKSDVLLLDEPTNHLDNAMIAYLEKQLIKYTGEIIMVTHDRYFLDRICNRIVEIDNSKLYNYEGSYQKYLEAKAEILATMNNEARKRATLLKSESAWIQRGAQGRGTKSKERIERYEELKNSRGDIVKESINMDSMESRLGKKTLILNDVSMRFDDKLLFENFNYNVLRNDRIGIVGNNGCGKSTLLKLIMGLKSPFSGTIERGETVKIGYFEQTNETMDPESRVIDYIKEVSNLIETKDGLVDASSMLETFLFSDKLQYSKISTLSGGEKRRLYLLKILVQAPNILILDEPTNDLDITTLAILEDYLSSFKGAVICVSHDRYFLDRVVDKIFEIKDNKITQFPGGYSDYLAKRDRGDSDIKLQKSNTISINNSKATIPTMSSKEKKELEGIDDAIAKLEQAIVDTQKDMDEQQNDYVKLAELSTKLTNLETELENMMERWMYLSELATTIKEFRKK